MLARVRGSNLAPLRQPVPMLPSQQSCDLGTHPHKDPMEPLNSPQGAKDFIYSLHPTERTTLLRELHRFESIAIAQGKNNNSSLLENVCHFPESHGEFIIVSLWSFTVSPLEAKLLGPETKE